MGEGGFGGMGVSKLKVTLEVQQRRKALVWLHTWLMVLLARLGIIGAEEGLRRAGQVLADSFYYRVDRGAWKQTSGKVEVA